MGKVNVVKGCYSEDDDWQDEWTESVHECREAADRAAEELEEQGWMAWVVEYPSDGNWGWAKSMVEEEE